MKSKLRKSPDGKGLMRVHEPTCPVCHMKLTLCVCKERNPMSLQQVQVQKRQHLAHLPSGRVLEFGNIIDCVQQADTCELTQLVGNQARTIVLEGDDAVAAQMFMRGIAFVTLRKEPAIETARVMPVTAKRRSDA